MSTSAESANHHNPALDEEVQRVRVEIADAICKAASARLRRGPVLQRGDGTLTTDRRRVVAGTPMGFVAFAGGGSLSLTIVSYAAWLLGIQFDEARAIDDGFLGESLYDPDLARWHELGCEFARKAGLSDTHVSSPSSNHVRAIALVAPILGERADVLQQRLREPRLLDQSTARHVAAVELALDEAEQRGAEGALEQLTGEPSALNSDDERA